MKNRLRSGRAHRAVLGVAVAGFVAAGTAVAASPAGAAAQTTRTLSADERQAPDQHRAPEQIRVPDGNKRIAVMPARGVQTYQCANGAWTFLQPDAILRFHGQAQVLHTRGPVWASVLDGSAVNATVVASAPRQNAVPELLLRSTANRGPGLLAAVTFIQRLDTTGGVSPIGACAEGATTSVPYTADYAFWTAA